MKKSLNTVIYILLWCACYFLLYFLLKNIILDKKTFTSVTIIVPSIIIMFVMDYNYSKYYKKNYMKVRETSEKYKLLCELNNKYKFNDLGETNRIVEEREYSHKSFDRARASSIILYQIENNESNIREFILNAYRNKKMYDSYLNDYNNLKAITSDEIINSTGIKKEKYLELENKLIKHERINDDIYNITIEVVDYYVTPSGRYSYSQNRVITYQELCDLYMQWRNGKKYNETSKRERKYMTDQMRYDVLKRDDFTCQKCGATAKDGAKLHVDHIVPVYKGGKTTMSNLQTLCDRCNIGKGTKDN